MPAKMKSVCEGCGGEILYEKDSTGEEVIEADPDQYANLCGTCSLKHRDSDIETSADFDHEHNRAMRTGGVGHTVK